MDLKPRSVPHLRLIQKSRRYLVAIHPSVAYSPHINSMLWSTQKCRNSGRTGGNEVDQRVIEIHGSANSAAVLNAPSLCLSTTSIMFNGV